MGLPPITFSNRKTRPMFKKAMTYHNREKTDWKGFIFGNFGFIYKLIRYSKLRIILSKKIKLETKTIKSQLL